MWVSINQAAEDPNRMKNQRTGQFALSTWAGTFLLSCLGHWHSWFSGLWSWTRTYTAGNTGHGLRLNYTIGFPDSAVCRWQIMGHLSLHNHFNHFVIISKYIHTHTYTYVHVCICLHPIGSISLVNPNRDIGTKTCYCCINTLTVKVALELDNEYRLEKFWGACYKKPTLLWTTVKRNSTEDSERKEENYREYLHLLREHLSHPEHSVGRNMTMW